MEALVLELRGFVSFSLAESANSLVCIFLGDHLDALKGKLVFFKKILNLPDISSLGKSA